MTLESLADELTLEERGGELSFTPSAFWSFGEGVVFGGYSAGVILFGSARAVGMGSIRSCNVMFLKPTRPNVEASVIIEVLAKGRSAVAIRATASQGGAVTTVVSAWCAPTLAHQGTALGQAEERAKVEACSSIEFRAATVQFMRVLDERAIDYPSGARDFLCGPPFVDVWVRPGLHSGGEDPMLSQVFDLMAFDAHMLDPVLRARQCDAFDTASLDLSVQWERVFEFGSWRELRVHAGVVSDGMMVTNARLHSSDGTIFARATQLGRARQATRPVWPKD